ncbi:MAG: substrate-binding domain-containing protein [Pseudomonadota bacterium]
MKRVISTLTLAGFFFAGSAYANEQIRIVGSSTVFPFATAVAEIFGQESDFKAPIVESTGSGGGLKLFCAGIGSEHPDITNASRAIKQSEIDSCASNGVTQIIEIKIGYDGIVIGQNNTQKQLSLTPRQVYLALAKDVPDAQGNFIPNPYTNWNAIDANLPDKPLRVMGPPPTSGTRDAFLELVMDEGAEEFDAFNSLSKSDKKKFAHTLREDGLFIEAGENDNLIVQKLGADDDLLGIFGFSFLEENRDQIQGARINDVPVTFETIASGDYIVSRPLFFYVKTQHLDVIPGLEEFVALFVSEDMIGADGAMSELALIPLSTAEREEMEGRLENRSHLSR